jgi:hypothetical protein
MRGGGGTRAQALTYVIALRQRAYGKTSGNITDAQLTLDFIRDERARELFWEGHRRAYLIRFDRFTTNGVWAWKGNVAAGRTTEAFRNLYRCRRRSCRRIRISTEPGLLSPHRDRQTKTLNHEEREGREGPLIGPRKIRFDPS